MRLRTPTGPRTGTIRGSLKQISIWITCLGVLQSGLCQTTGRIAGIVRDPSGAVIAGALVTCSQEGSGEERRVLTDRSGAYLAPVLPPGTYQVTFSAKGFATRKFEKVILALTETTELDTELTLAAESSTISVNAVPLLQTAGPQLGRVVDSRAVSGLPLATRNFTQILGLSPGTATYLPDNTGLGRNTQTISVNGARVTQNSLQLNGVDVNTMGTAGRSALCCLRTCPENGRGRLFLRPPVGEIGLTGRPSLGIRGGLLRGPRPCHCPLSGPPRQSPVP